MSSLAVCDDPFSDLLFITQTGPKRRKDQQRVVRKHVMRNIGFSRRKEKTNDKHHFTQIVLEVPDTFDYSTSLPTENHERSTGSYTQSGPMPFILPKIDRLWTGRMDPFVNYPIKMNRQTLKLMDHIFDERYGNTPPFRDAWLPIGMSHAASFHQVIANASMNLASLRAKDSVPEQREALYHHNIALELAAKELLDPETATSDGLIGSILAFACYSHIIGDQDRWHMHMKATRDIIERRGGVDTLISNPLLWIVLFWVDMGGSVTEDIQSYFPLPSKVIPPQPLEHIPPSTLTRQIANIWCCEFPDDIEIMDVMDDMRSYSAFLRHQVETTQGAVYSNGATAAYGILPLLYRLVGYFSTSPESAQHKLDIVRLGFILYFSEIQRLFGIMGIMSTRQIKKLQSSIVEQGGDDWGSLEILKAWVLAMACIETKGERREWFLTHLHLSKDRLNIESWGEMERQFKDILWYGDVHSVLFWEALSGVEQAPPSGLLNHGSRFGGYRLLQ